MRQCGPRTAWTADESPKAAFNDTSAGFAPDVANASRFHSAPLQRRPVNRSTGPRFHACRAVLSAVGPAKEEALAKAGPLHSSAAVTPRRQRRRHPPTATARVSPGRQKSEQHQEPYCMPPTPMEPFQSDLGIANLKENMSVSP